MKQVLWISRHPISEEQRKDLEQICGGSVCLHWWRENVEDIQALEETVAGADMIAAVLPLHLLAALVDMAGERMVLIACAKRELIDAGGPEAQVRFTHGGWQRIRRLEVELEPVRTGG